MDTRKALLLSIKKAIDEFEKNKENKTIFYNNRYFDLTVRVV